MVSVPLKNNEWHDVEPVLLEIVEKESSNPQSTFLFKKNSQRSFTRPRYGPGMQDQTRRKLYPTTAYLLKYDGTLARSIDEEKEYTLEGLKYDEVYQAYRNICLVRPSAKDRLQEINIFEVTCGK